MLLWLVVGHAVVTAAMRLGFGVHIALIKPGEPIDLLYRYDEVRQWFSGVLIYGQLANSDYPPGSYALLWPFMGWLSVPAARAVYVGAAVASLCVIAVVSARASGFTGRAALAFAAVFLLPAGATQLTLWVGQLGLHVVAALMAAAALLLGARPRSVDAEPEERASWSVDIAAAGLLTASLVKPTVSVPMVAIILVMTGRWRPAVLTGAMYVGLILIAAAPHAESPVGLHRLWLGQEGVANLPKGSVNIHLWLHWLGVRGSLILASLALLLVGTAWAWFHRRAEPWIVLGVAALLARVWAHHRAYDDVLLVITAVALFQVISRCAAGRVATAVLAAILAGGVYVGGHIPMWAYLTGASPHLWLSAELFRSVTWASVLGFLLWYAHRSHRARSEEHVTTA